jgi:RNA polymerase primary sigma factor
MGKKFIIKQTITDRKDDSLKIYFKDISKYSILSPEEEADLTNKIKNGDNQAATKLINANLRFVISVAKQYQGRGFDLVDLIQEGNCGLIEAARKYDPTKGFRFISYAVWWIRQGILKALFYKSKTIHIPTNQLLNSIKVNKAVRQYESENEIKPSTDELEDLTNLSSEKINNSLASYYKTVSLETPFKTEDGGCLIDVFPNDNSKLPNEGVIKEDLHNELETILSKLPDRNSDIIRMIFGISMQSMSFDEVADRFGIGEERVKQIIRSTLKTIKDKYGEKLIEFI